MRKTLSLLLSIVLIITVLPIANIAFGKSDKKIDVTNLRTEYTNNPLGIDVTEPRLSWELESSNRGQKQTAYQIQVASNKSQLLKNEPDLWDTGKVDSDESVNIVYEGKALESKKRYFWRVKVWDNHGEKPSKWSKPAWLEMGLLDESAWQAEWIGLEGEYGVPIDTSVRNVTSRLESGHTLGQSFTMKGKFTTVDVQIPNWGNPESAFTLKIYKDNPQGEVLAEERFSNFRNASWVSMELEEALPSGIYYLEASDVAKDIAWYSHTDDVYSGGTAYVDGKPVDGDRTLRVETSPAPAPLLRKEFPVEKPVKQARVYVSGLGFYELALNGEKVGDRVLDPNSTNYEETVLYTTYDVTNQLNQGDNAIGVELGRGKYGMTSPTIWFWHTAPWHDDPKLLLQMEIEYEDGSTDTIISDESWRAAEGPTRFDSLYEGEVFDARLVQKGWTSSEFDDTEWKKVSKVAAPDGELHAFQHEAIKEIDTIQPKSVEEVSPGVYEFDFGINVAGWAELQVEGPKGTEVTLSYSEKSEKGFSTRQALVNGPLQTDHYILNGEGVETWKPKFSYKGYQYIRVSGYPGKPTLDSLKGYVIHTSVASTGEFSSSNQLLNQINKNVRRAYLNNLYDVVTDTPVYEKNGWTGDAQVMAATSIYNFHMPRFYTKWLNDVRDSQRPSGEIPDIVPSAGFSYEGAPGWDAAHGPTPIWDAVLFEIPWEMYRHYGDKRILANVYEEMKLYLDYIGSKADGHIVRMGLGDWISPGYVGTPPEGPDLTSTAYYYRFASTLSSVAKVLGDESKASMYEEKASAIKAAFNEEFFNTETNVYNTARDAGYRQTSNAVPLAFGLVPKGHEKDVVANLVKDVEEHDNHLNTGIVGTKFLLPVLTEHGYKDLAYTIATQRTFPSWGHWIENGATALLENWELTSRSQSHHFFGTVSEWFYAYLAGIQPEEPGYNKVKIKPYMPKDLKQAEGRLETVKGDVLSSWKQLKDGKISLKVEIPVNTTANVYVPADSQWAVTEGDQLAHEADGITFTGMEDGYAVYEVGSGSYKFNAEH
ncbi:alpha-L-rhamnosidase [Metabacillus bambusae]|uniref:alpha-L-rhamnosidase n=1 Tax=Metabacillus bambusae TaxID=2795218 RepID=A0ABS3MZV3_9BACI|nr:alpha-L-rhamnosidase [Metabacillus bambusae]MBO1511514.1 family 78 glycoside hydrolase catalytic domain [Metabacillus bambusae]